MIPGLDAVRSAREPAALAIRVRTVLVVDEALPVRRKLLDILQRSGVARDEARTASDAEEALAIYARDRPALVLCELVGEPGVGLAMVLEMLALDPHAKIVLVTAEDPGSALVRQAIRAGVFGVVQKPLRHEAIRNILAEIESEEGGIERFR